MKSSWYLAFITAALLLIVIVAKGLRANSLSFEEGKELIVLRQIGHEILLHAGDSTSRVLPVKQTADNQYQLQFESSFAFMPDSLVKIINQAVVKYKLPSNYIVNVIECANQGLIWGYAFLNTKQDAIIPCSGRKQPRGCYLIRLTFQDADISNWQNIYIAGGMSLLSLVIGYTGLMAYSKNKRLATLKKEPPIVTDTAIPIGKYLFSPDQQYLLINNEQIRLTNKESKLLYMLASAPNQVIDRSSLQRIWEDEGVIVNRSLDMFVSKLRKKLEKDPAISIQNVPGRGYKLGIDG
jgi:hypothetical protein